MELCGPAASHLLSARIPFESPPRWMRSGLRTSVTRTQEGPELPRTGPRCWTLNLNLRLHSLSMFDTVNLNLRLHSLSMFDTVNLNLRLHSLSMFDTVNLNLRLHSLWSLHTSDCRQVRYGVLRCWTWSRRPTSTRSQLCCIG